MCVRRHAENKLALPNRNNIKTYNSPTIPSSINTPNLKGIDGNLYLKKTKLRKQSEMGSVKTKSGRRNQQITKSKVNSRSQIK